MEGVEIVVAGVAVVVVVVVAVVVILIVNITTFCNGDNDEGEITMANAMTMLAKPTHDSTTSPPPPPTTLT